MDPSKCRREDLQASPRSRHVNLSQVNPIPLQPFEANLDPSKAISRLEQASSDPSPRLGPTRATAFDGAGSIFEHQGQTLGIGRNYAGSEESWDERSDNQGVMLPEAALVPEDTPPETSTPSDKEDGLLSRDKQRKTAYYDYATDRSLSHADAKLFYQRSQLEAQKTGGSNWDNSQHSVSGSPILHPKGFGSVYEAEQAGMRRTGSVNSMKSTHNAGPRSVVIPLGHCYKLTAIVLADINPPFLLV